MTGYRERLYAPWWWYPVGIGSGFILGFEVGNYFWEVLGAVVALMLAAAAFSFLMGRRLVEVRDGELRTGREHVAVSRLGPPVLRSGERLRLRLGPEGDPGATVCYRWWIREAVEFPVPDTQSYWLVSTRHPTELAAAVEAARSANGAPAH